MEITIPAWKAYKYKEVWKVTEWKDGCIFKTECMNVYIEAAGFSNPLGRDYVLASISTDVLEQETITLNVVQIDDPLFS